MMNNNSENINFKYEEENDEQLLAGRLDYYNSIPKILFKHKALSDEKKSSDDEKSSDEEILKQICEILEESKIYIPTYEKLNDPLEGLNSKLLGIDESERENIRKNWQILALTSDGLIPSLWAYYSGNYNGISIGFKTHQTFDTVKKVEYISKSDAWTTDIESSISDDLCKKNISWEHEKEWRYIRDNTSNKFDNYFTFRKDDIICIFLGYKIAPDKIDKILSKKPESAKIFTVKPDEKNFCICAIDYNNTDKVIYTMDELYKYLAIDKEYDLNDKEVFENF